MEIVFPLLVTKGEEFDGTISEVVDPLGILTKVLPKFIFSRPGSPTDHFNDLLDCQLRVFLL